MLIGLSNQTRSQHNLTVKQLNGRTVEQRCIQHQSELFQFLNEFCIWFSSRFSSVIWSLDPRISLSSLMNALSSFTFKSGQKI
ncbi:hypothetical protein BpHYR1_026005 [Brachionus plicatilis]|uniref:Uncharacterized protein n=1 Tax=Brachionus plicatilis TaxID=10195 RepID=A0A3M7R1W7_BRAPC|nr:hypothetical protein BpHYR1_026005 [Brachionus plicatilis]